MRHFRIFAAALLAALATVGNAQSSVRLAADSQGRPTAPVRINGQGPFDLVVDTAAQRTGLGADLVGRLELSPLEGEGATLHGAAGARRMNLYRLDSLAIGSVQREAVVATELVGGGVTHTHQGVLGADMFAGRSVEFDFEQGQLKIAPAGAEPPTGFAAIPARMVMGTFVIVPITIGGVEAVGVIDTGAQHSVANGHLMRALGYAEDDSRLRVEQVHGGATNHSAVMRSGARSAARFAEADLGEIELRFSDLPVFTPLGMADGPAIILGIEALRQLKALAIDYQRQELQLRR